MAPAEVPVSEFLSAVLDRASAHFSERGIELTTDIASDVRLKADPEAMKQMLDELTLNTLKFALTKAEFSLKSENGHVLLEIRNDAALPDGPANQVFDRFTVLENAKDAENGAGLGLAYVKAIVKAHNGRADAAVSGGFFTLRITL